VPVPPTVAEAQILLQPFDVARLVTMRKVGGHGVGGIVQ
jgi:hypothetical protein